MVGLHADGIIERAGHRDTESQRHAKTRADAKTRAAAGCSHVSCLHCTHGHQVVPSIAAAATRCHFRRVPNHKISTTMAATTANPGYRARRTPQFPGKITLPEQPQQLARIIW